MPVMEPYMFLDNMLIDDFIALTPLVLYLLTGWTTDISKISAKDDSIIKQYLLQAEFLEESSRCTIFAGISIYILCVIKYLKCMQHVTYWNFEFSVMFDGIFSLCSTLQG